MKLNIGVIFGGNSVEHEISIITATEMMGYLDDAKYNIIPIYIDKDNVWYTGYHFSKILNFRDIEVMKRYGRKVALLKKGKRFVLQTLTGFKRDLKVIDIIIPMGHGSFLEDGSLQGYLNMIGIPYAGCDVLASSLGQDKVYMKQILEFNNIPVANYVWFYHHEYEKDKKNVLDKISKLKYPLYVKPASLGSSIGIRRITKEEELNNALKEAFTFDKKVLVEEEIKNVKEINISVLGNTEKQEVSEIEQINTSGFYSFKEKYVEKCSKTVNKTKNSEPILSKEMISDLKDLALATFKAIGAEGVSRIDFLIDDKNRKIYVNEINTIPGSMSSYLWLAKKKNQTELLDDLISLAVKKQEQKKKIIYSFERNLLENFDELEMFKFKNKNKNK